MKIKHLYLYMYSVLLVVCFLTLIGCKDNSTGTGPIGTITVAGKVIDEAGNDIRSATISIGDSIKTTDINGNFSISGVTTPYDAKIIASGMNGIVYEDLTTTSPQLLAITISGTAKNFATLNVTIPALTINQKALVIFTDQALVQSSTTINFPATVGSLFVGWPGGTSLSGKIIVMVYTLAGSNITTYDKYGEKSGFTLNNGGTQSVTFTAAELTLNPPESTISGEFTLPAGFNIASNSVGLKFISTASNYLFSQLYSINTAMFNFVVPIGLPTPNQFVISGFANEVTGQFTAKKVAVTAPTAGLTIVLETPSSLATPPNAATNIDTNTNFTYSPGSGTGIYLILFSSPGRSFSVITSSATTHIPNLNLFGLGIGSSLSYTWYSVRYNGIPSTDAFVSVPVLLNPLYSSITRSVSRTFTTVP